MSYNCRRTTHHPRTQAAVCVVVLGLFGLTAFAGNAASSRPGKRDVTGQKASEGDLAAIRAESRAFVAAFNKRDAKAIAALWTVDGEYVDDGGRAFSGRDAIEKGYAQFFADSPKTEMRIMIDSLRLLSDGAAIEDGRAILDPAPAGAPGFSKYIAVHVKADGKWLMATVRDTWVETPSAHANIADLEWLIGTWIAEEHGVKSESVCRWVANKSFVERKYTTTHADGMATSGVQLIGWNPHGGHVQSWDFSPGGGHAIGVWSPRAGGWTAEVHGMMGDGTPTVAVNVLMRLDEDAYVWQSVRRTAGGVVLPDTDEVVLKRQPATP